MRFIGRRDRLRRSFASAWSGPSGPPPATGASSSTSPSTTEAGRIVDAARAFESGTEDEFRPTSTRRRCTTRICRSGPAASADLQLPALAVRVLGLVFRDELWRTSPAPRWRSRWRSSSRGRRFGAECGPFGNPDTIWRLQIRPPCPQPNSAYYSASCVRGVLGFARQIAPDLPNGPLDGPLRRGDVHRRAAAGRERRPRRSRRPRRGETLKRILVAIPWILFAIAITVAGGIYSRSR